MHSFFKYSAKRIQDYFETDFITDLDPQKILRHVQTRWLSLQKVFMRIYEQLKNLKVYFLETVTKDTSFKGKNGAGASSRYLRSKKLLMTKKLPVIIAAVIYVADVFHAYTIPMQTTRPMITVFYTKMIKLLRDLLKLFMRNDVVFTNKEKTLLPLKNSKQ